MNAWRRSGGCSPSGRWRSCSQDCFKVNMDVEVTPENTVSGTAIIAVDESLLELSGQSADQLFQDMDLSDLPAGASVDPYEEDGFVGQQITFDEVSLEDFRGNNTLSGAGAERSTGHRAAG